MMKYGKYLLSVFMMGLMAMSASCSQKNAVITPLEAVPSGTWQAEVTFPDWAGYVDDTLAMNSIYSFDGYKDQGELYLSVGENVDGFDLFINNREIPARKLGSGVYKIDFSRVALNGTNTVQISNITAKEDRAEDTTVTVTIPYPVVINGTLKEAGIEEAPLKLISSIIQSDIDHGFSSAQLAIVKDGKLVYQNAWGLTNSYSPDGTPLTDTAPVTNDTLYDLASNTKMYAAAYAVQYLVDCGELSLTDKAVDIIGQRFADDTLEIRFAAFGGKYPGLETIKEWKRRITVKDLLMHQAGFQDNGHYHNAKYDQVNQALVPDVDNVLFIPDADKEKTLEGICRTPLMREPGSAAVYSDIDYMLLGLIVERKTGKDLNTFLSETFWEPMGLTHITYCPLEHGFGKDDCAATELNGNTRGGLVSFPGVRTATIQGEVHDEESFYMMEGMSGHAGLFSNAADLARLASVMLTGGYGNNRFFSKNTRDLFISPQADGPANYGIGWWREADNRRVWYFGTQSPENTVGHQGWTGTLTMIDFENRMAVVYLTNRINTPLAGPSSLEMANTFCGDYYTSATLGFVPQILYMGMNGQNADLDKALDRLAADMAKEKQKLVEKQAAADGRPLDEDHPLMKAYAAIRETADKRK